MLTRKTQYAWMALGGLICLFGLILACKLREGNKAIAQVDKPPVLLLGAVEDKIPASPPTASKNPKPISSDFMPFTRSSPPSPPLPPPAEYQKPKGTSQPKAVLEMPLPMEMASPPKLPPSAPLTKPLSTPPPPSLAPQPPYNGLLSPVSFDANTPTKKIEKKRDKKEPSKADTLPAKPAMPSAGLIGYAPLTADKKPTSPPSTLVPPSAPLLTKDAPSSSPVPSWNNPDAKVAPTSYAPPTAAAPSTTHGQDHESKSQPGEPPLAPAPGPVQMYHVHGSETLQDIARRTLGSADRWSDLHKLNPTLKPDTPLGAGTTVRLPGDACVQADELEPVKALPALRPKPTAPRAKVLPLTGTYQCSLDEKNQLTLPRALRDQFGGSETVLISPGPDKCLWLTNQPHLERLGERLDQSQANEADVRVFKRLYFAQTEKLSVNTDGRVAIPDRLATFAGLHQELVLVGIDDHFEVWDAGRWRQYTQQKGAGRAAATAEAE